MITLSLGFVAPTSTTVATIATVNAASLTPPLSVNGPVWVQSVSFQAIETNTGIIYICDRTNPNLTTGIGVLWKLPVPDSSAKKAIPAWVIGDPSRSNNPVNVAQFYILPAVSGEGVGVAAIRSGTSQNFLS
jgi:hypothetical protein